MAFALTLLPIMTYITGHNNNEERIDTKRQPILKIVISDTTLLQYLYVHCTELISIIVFFTAFIVDVSYHSYV